MTFRSVRSSARSGWVAPSEPNVGQVNNWQLRPAGRRLGSVSSTLTSWHSMSFGADYEADNIFFGVLLANNDFLLAPGAGFDDHHHAEMEIVTWVVSGTLTHRDSEGNGGVLTPGIAQRMSAGTGIVHSEYNDADEPLRFIQMWV